ncbi:CDP-diacylglycerol--glycerol-3-phosphate 3-phosphatidyltransferase [Pelodictyon phaeoclathratiforme]|uniref:CDP-diacylglycerol--glycerol-3-phosphate 3-phosphatidyltransferase n=1 Tax=Pelodictyon phaeoclathratiforme (strain DSM 5477 / BU-1) TaxID=324925 RepID=B4SDQ3_PELPB|nr:CDP-diacylglycerol--glycerol-3-phosphate 3-phosphatidyltransferase [Pelodictyon phaeoclathratiforme]ACF44421.1 CDP-diacylglycerol/glycerol-3-phosphate 3-phosphatidyltransferase [Pelodictyon phaeoclathratiforme BU-1]MBV5289367.1 CDP-diacylglycerol--glycerol-3-phosphate 3-phosphatidyltransferase [Pelodictyon phaeoclathratiforme]
MKEEYQTYFTVPNQLTALRILLVPVFVVLLLQVDPWFKLFGVLVFAVASLTDIYDGYHARKYGVETRLGAFLDPLADKLLITAAFLLYVWMGYLVLWMVVLVVVRDVVITALRIYAEYKNKPVVTSVEAKYKTVVQNVFVYAIMVLMLMKESAFSGKSVAVMINGFLGSGYLDFVMLAVTVFTVYTGISYLVSNWKIYFQKPLQE